MEFKPFEDKEEVEKIKKERDQLIAMLANFDMPDSERRFLKRKIAVITQRLLHKARYSKNPE